jgi:hypothetical protein
MTQTQTVAATFAAPARVVTRTAGAGFSVKVGTAVTWTAAASRATPPLQYRFRRHDLTTGTSMMMVRDYAAGHTLAWTAMARDVGQHTFAVGVPSANVVRAVRRSQFRRAEPGTREAGPPGGSGGRHV